MPAGITIFSTILFIVLIIIFLAGLVSAVAPKWLWKTFSSWKATKEPSKAYFLVQRISGVFIMIIVAAIALFPTLISYFDK